MKNTTTDIVGTAVALANIGNQGTVEREGLRLLNLIQGERASIRQCDARIEEHRQTLKEIGDNSITIEGIMGDVELPNDGNPNTATILAVIARANKDAQEAVNVTSTNLVNDISAEERNIAAARKRITELREKLSKLAADSVTVKEVMGS